MAVAGDGDFSGGGDLPSGSFAAFCTSNEKLTNSIGLKEGKINYMDHQHKTNEINRGAVARGRSKRHAHCGVNGRGWEEGRLPSVSSSTSNDVCRFTGFNEL